MVLAQEQAQGLKASGLVVGWKALERLLAKQIRLALEKPAQRDVAGFEAAEKMSLVLT